MSAFRAGEIDVLVCTTVIEVGVDVPNATVMVVMDADRFGISQLHQLRGRIGRGEHPSLCLLATKLPEESKAGERLKAVAGTQDGFELADLDLRERQRGRCAGAAPVRPTHHPCGSCRSPTTSRSFSARGSCARRCTKPTRCDPRHGGVGGAVHRHRPRRVPGQVVSRSRLLWLVFAAMLAVVVAYPGDVDVAGAVASSSPRPTSRPSRRVSTCSPASARFRCGCADTTTAETRSASPGPTTTTAPGGHNGCDTRNDILDRDLVDKTYVAIKRCPTAVATGTLRDPYTNATVAVHARQPDRRRGADRPPGAAGAGLGPRCARNWTDEMRVRFANDPANLLAVCRARPIRTRATGSRPTGCRRTRVPLPVRDAVHRGAARLRVARRRTVSAGAARRRARACSDG